MDRSMKEHKDKIIDFLIKTVMDIDPKVHRNYKGWELEQDLVEAVWKYWLTWMQVEADWILHDWKWVNFL